MIVDMRELCTEWGLMNEFERSAMRRRVIYTAAQVGGLWGALLPMTFASWIFKQLGIEVTSLSDLALPWLGLGLAGGVVGFAMHFIPLRKRLKELVKRSDERMRNPKYVAKLAAAGLIARPSKIMEGLAVTKLSKDVEAAGPRLYR